MPEEPMRRGRRWTDRNGWVLVLGIYLSAVLLAANVAAAVITQVQLARVARGLKADSEAVSTRQGAIIDELRLQRAVIGKSIDSSDTQHLVLGQLVREHRRYWRQICLNTARSEEAVRECFKTLKGEGAIPGEPRK